METMTLTIHIPRNVGIILQKKAELQGLSLEEYISFLLEQYVNGQKSN